MEKISKYFAELDKMIENYPNRDTFYKLFDGVSSDSLMSALEENNSESKKIAKVMSRVGKTLLDRITLDKVFRGKALEFPMTVPPKNKRPSSSCTTDGGYYFSLDEDYKNDVVEEKVIVKSGEKYIAKVYYPDLSLLNLPYGQNFNSEAVNKLFDAAKRFSVYHNLLVLGVDGLILFANEWNTLKEKIVPMHTDLLLFSPSKKRIFPSLKSKGNCLCYMSAIKSYQVKDYRAAFCFFKKVKSK